MNNNTLLIIWLIPSINVVFLNLFEYMETVFYWGFEQINSWFIQFLFVIINGFFYDFHYVLALAIPIILYKYLKKFNCVCVLFTVTSIFIANLLMLNIELVRLGYETFPQYLIKPICITMISVIILSISITIHLKNKSNVNYNKNR